ncbi:hypothetical protein J3S85_37615 [Streptomyces lavenduligriseus]|nr:hypothetical protein J3S85_37615 [Streptomyces lavenduligriseus]
MDREQVEKLRQQFTEITDELRKDLSRAAYHFGRLEIITKELFRLVDRNT